MIIHLLNSALAQSQTYVPLATLPGISGSYDTSSLTGYLNTVFQIGIGVAAGLAVVRIVIGGIQYMSTDAIGGKEEGKDIITSALWGLLLALISFIILNTINPALVSTGLQINDVSINGAVAQAIPPGVTASSPYGAGAGYGGNDTTGLVQNADGTYSLTTNHVAIDTDGKNPPPFSDPDYQPTTSYGGLDANNDYYVVVPINSSIKNGTQVLVTNNDTGVSTMAIVGDRGPAYGEMSTALGKYLGVTSGTSNSASSANISYTFYK